jgi:benzoyl-CoA reductase subunit B
MAKRLPSIIQVGRLVDEFYEELRRAPEEGRPVVWAGGFPTTFPIYRAMDIAYLFEDVYAATAAARHKEGRLQEIAADEGYLIDQCSYSRTTLGMAHMSEAERATADPYYRMPRPNAVVPVDVGCSMLGWWADATRRHFNVPMYTIQVPYVWRREDEEEAIQDLVPQFRGLIAFLEEVTGRRMDWDRLKEVMGYVKEAITLRVEAMDIAGRAVPSPVTFFDWSASLGAVNYAIGTPRAVEIFRQIKEEVQERVARGEGAIPDERVRVYWEGHMNWPYMSWWGRTLAELGVNIIAAKYTHLGFLHRPDRIDPDRPLESLAANSICVLSYGIDLLTEQVMNFCREYRLDAVLGHYTRTCRIMAGPYYQMMDIISRRLGLPGIAFEGDVADKSFMSTEQTRTRLEALVETVLSRKAAQGI